jgi:hypothetical protein
MAQQGVPPFGCIASGITPVRRLFVLPVMGVAYFGSGYLGASVAVQDDQDQEQGGELRGMVNFTRIMSHFPLHKLP